MKTWLARIAAALPLPVVIVLPALVISAVAVLLTGWLTMHHTRTATLQLADDLLSARLYHINDNITAYMRDAEAASRLYASVRRELLRDGSVNEEHLRGQFTSRMQSFSHLDAIGATLLTADGAHVLVQVRGEEGLADLDIHYTHGTSTTLITALPTGDVTTTIALKSSIFAAHLNRLQDLYSPRWFLRDDLAPHPAIAMYMQPIRDDEGDLLGAVYTSVYLNQVSQFLSTIRSSPHEELLIVDYAGRIVASSDPTYQRNIFATLSDPHDPYLHHLEQGLRHGNLIAPLNTSQYPFRFEVAGNGYLARALGCGNCTGLDWTIIAVMPERALLGAVQRSTISTVLLLIGSLLVATVAGFITTQWIIRPLRSLSHTAQQVASGDWTHPIDPLITQRSDAIGELARSFDHMGSQLRRSFAEVAQRNHELITLIARQQQTETRLRDSQMLLQGIMDYAPLAITVFDRTGTYKLASTYAINLLQRTPQEIIGAQLDEVLPERLSRESYAEMQQIIETGNPVNGEFVLELHGKQTAFWYTTFPLLDSAGNVVAFAEIANDISERIQMESALRESEQRFRFALEYAPLAVFLCTRDNFLFVNATAATMLGYTHTELLTTPPLSLLPPDYRDQAALYAEQLRQAFDSINLELPVLSGKGPPRLLDIHVTVLPYGDDLVWLSMATDVTARSATEQALRSAYTAVQQLNTQLAHSRDTLRTLLDGLDEAVMMVEQEGTIVNLNQPMAELIGQPANVVVGHHWAELWLGTDIARTLQALIDATHNTGRAQHARLRTAHCKSQPRIYNIRTLPITGESGAAWNLIVHITDVTEEVQMLAHASRIEAFAASGVLAASVAHEVNTPLQTVMNALSFLPTVTGKDQELLLEAARSEIKRAGQIIRQFLDLYRPRPASPASPDWVNCNTIIERLLLLLGRRIKEQGIVLEQYLQPDLPEIAGHPDQLTQVLLNILVNALDAMNVQPTAGRLTIATESIRHDEQEYVEVRIHDTGSGISDELLPYIFDPFVTTKPNGTGLGLAISHRIIQQHHGTIYISSQVGDGTTFTVVLPTTAALSVAQEIDLRETTSTHLTR